jgi:hypothetical protein
MNILKIELKNPIASKEVDKLIEKLLKVNNFEYLLIDYGKHEFESIEVIKYCREQLKKIESRLLKYKKISMVSVPPYTNKSENPNKMRFFHSLRDAEQWFKQLIE